MNILLTGASSFTGMWFAEALAARGHAVCASFRRSADGYTGLRGERVERVTRRVTPAWECAFGDGRFLDRIRAESRWDVLCHHAAEVENYRSPGFDAGAAVERNTSNLAAVLRELVARGLEAVVLTGSVFEPGEGAGDEPLVAFSPYGLSKALTAKRMAAECARVGLAMNKFVIPNPFGPLEEARFTSYLFHTWGRGKPAEVRTPRYVRDNIHVSLLALAYSRFVESAVGSRVANRKLNPSGYVETQELFARRVAGEASVRLGWACGIEILAHDTLEEPLRRVNTDPPDAAALGWSETAAWDELTRYYERRVASAA